MAGSNRVNCGQFNGGTFYKGVGRVKANEYIYQHKEASVALRPRAKGERAIIGPQAALELGLRRGSMVFM